MPSDNLGNENSRLRERIYEIERELERLRVVERMTEAASSLDGLEWLLRSNGAGQTDEKPTRSAVQITGVYSVIVPAYNAERWLSRCVRSVWEQDFPRDRIELIVIDDGSSDGTVALAEKLEKRSPVPMRVLHHEGRRNRGVSATRRLGCAYARGEFLALLDADDEFLPNRLAVADLQFAKHRTAVAVCAHGRNVDQDGEPTIGHNGTLRAGDWRSLEADLMPPFTFEQLWIADPIVNSSLTIRRDAYEQVGGYPAVMAHQSEDWLIVMKLSLLAPIPCGEEDVALYRNHAAAYTTQYHSDNLVLGSRAEMFYHLVWWMLQHPAFAERGADFFRREYPGMLSANGRLVAVVREYIRHNGASFPTRVDFENHLARNQAELESLRRVVQTKLHEARQWRLEALALREQISAKSDR